MSLFTKSTKDTQDTETKWKAKYFSLLDEQDHSNKALQEEQDLLCKTIVRLSLAVKGLDKQLDPHLVHIRNQLKSGLKAEQLRSALHEFSNALIQFEDYHKLPPQENADLLFAFLYQHYPEQQALLGTIANRYQQQAFTQQSDLFTAILDVLPQSGTLLTAQTTLPAPQQLIDVESLTLELIQLIESIETPATFETQAEAIKQRLLEHANPDDFQLILHDATKLLQGIKKHQQSEQKEMALFLSSLTEQLSELSLKATGASQTTQIAAQKRNLLDQSVSAQMSDLQKSSADATNLEHLKHIVTTRISGITQQIHEHAKQDELHRQETEKQLEELTLKIIQLDAESKELKNHLIIAHSKASRDPLTNLPNRLAYDAVLGKEIARWKRYKTIFSLLIWDIDFFKRINDTYGHKAGDKTLIIIANLLAKLCREADFVARFGGEEFVMILPCTDEKSALVLANKIRTTIENTGFNSNGEKIAITVSCGITQYREGDNGDTLFERADTALYTAKANGRNQCIVYDASLT